MKKPDYNELSRRERQIMDIIYRLGEASVADVLNHITDPPGYNSIRVILTILENKGHLMHRQAGQKYIYLPAVQTEQTKKSALKHMISTFFEGSTPKLLSTIIDISAADLKESELNELSKIIEQAKTEKNK